LINGEEIMVSNVTIIGSGDALQTNGTAYFSNCLIIGDGDTILGAGLRSLKTVKFVRSARLCGYAIPTPITAMCLSIAG
jgi:pectin methylesterase-like acyl-CoA thioesterase